MTVAARDDWCVGDVKCFIERAIGIFKNKQRLLDAAGVHLRDDYMLGDVCSLGEATVDLTLVKLPLTQTEMEWQRTWREMTPEWLQQCTEKVIDQQQFNEMRQAATDMQQCPFHTGSRQGRAVCSCMNQPNTRREPVEPAPPLTAAGLAALQSHLIEPRIRMTCNDEVELLDTAAPLWRRAMSMPTLLQAVEEWPALILPLVHDLILLLKLVKQLKGIFHYLPADFVMHRELFYEALDYDEELAKEFMQTAGKAEIHAWKWAKAEKNKWSKSKSRSKKNRSRRR